VFDGKYITGDITEDYLNTLERSRSDVDKGSDLKHSDVVGLYNINKAHN
jgi:amidophosphoribosyltransferase